MGFPLINRVIALLKNPFLSAAWNSLEVVYSFNLALMSFLGGPYNSSKGPSFETFNLSGSLLLTAGVKVQFSTSSSFIKIFFFSSENRLSSQIPSRLRYCQILCSLAERDSRITLELSDCGFPAGAQKPTLLLDIA